LTTTSQKGEGNHV